MYPMLMHPMQFLLQACRNRCLGNNVKFD